MKKCIFPFLFFLFSPFVGNGQEIISITDYVPLSRTEYQLDITSSSSDTVRLLEASFYNYDDPDYRLANSRFNKKINPGSSLAVDGNFPYDIFLPRNVNLLIELVYLAVDPTDGVLKEFETSYIGYHTYSGTDVYDFILNSTNSGHKYWIDFNITNLGNQLINEYQYSLYTGTTLLTNGTVIPKNAGSYHESFGVEIPSDLTIKNIPNDTPVNGLDPESYRIVITAKYTKGNLPPQTVEKTFYFAHKWHLNPRSPVIHTTTPALTSETSIQFSVSEVRLFKYQIDNGDWSGWIKANATEIRISQLTSGTIHSLNVIGLDMNDNISDLVNFTWTVNDLHNLNKEKNYILSATPLLPVKTDSDMQGLLPGQITQSVVYYDPFGRKEQAVSIRASSTQKDIILPYSYDHTGKQSIDYLPYVSSQSTGAFGSDAMSGQSQYYAGVGYDPARDLALTYFPYSETIYERSPMNRVIRKGTVGELWQVNPSVNSVRKNMVTAEHTVLPNNTYEFTYPLSQFNAIGLNFITVNFPWVQLGSQAVPGISASTHQVVPGVSPKIWAEGEVNVSFSDNTTRQFPFEGSSLQTAGSPFLKDDATKQITSIRISITRFEVTYVNPNPEIPVSFSWKMAVVVNGNDWTNSAAAITHPVSFDYYVNGSSEIPILKVGPDGLLMVSGWYQEGTLTREGVTDENGNRSDVYKTQSGLTLLSRSKNMVNGVLTDVETMNVYDEMDNLIFIIPPMAMDALRKNGWQFLEYIHSTWLTEFRYDDRGQVIYKKIPETEPVLTIYDRLGRVALSQDALLREKNQWLFSKYDQDGRSIVSGVFNDWANRSRDELQQVIFTQPHLFELKDYSQTGVTLDRNQGYTSRVFPSSDFIIYSVTYYDDYDFPGIPTSVKTFDTTVGYHTSYFTRIKGSVTGFRERILNRSLYLTQDGAQYVELFNPDYKKINIKANQIRLLAGFRSVYGQQLRISPTMPVPEGDDGLNWICGVSFYDEWGRVIQSRSINTKGGTDVTVAEYDFSGKTLRTKSVHQIPGQTAVTTTQRFTYNLANQLVDTWHQINSGPEVLLQRFKYNEMGTLTDKSVYSTNGTAPNPTFMQSIDYAYNIRGWMTHLNNSSLTNDGIYNDDANDVFGMELLYESGLSGLNGTPLYNGTITGQKWQTRGQTNGVNGYGYQYDNLYQLKLGRHGVLTGSVWDNYNRFTEQDISYDLNGNINRMNRRGYHEELTNVSMDDLNYYYLGNKLMAMKDVVNPLLFSTDFDGLPTNNTNNVIEPVSVAYNSFETTSSIEDYAIAGSTGLLSLKAAAIDEGTGQLLELKSNPVPYKNPNEFARTVSPILITPSINYKLSGTAKTNGYSSSVGLQWFSDEACTQPVRKDTLLIQQFTQPAFSLNVVAPATARFVKIVLRVGNTLTGDEYLRVDNLKLDAVPVYDYDAAGNLIADGNKGMTVHYNYLNLPETVDFGGGNKIVWTYTASGSMIRKQVYTAGTLTVTREYVGGYEYVNNTLSFMGTPDGRAKPVTGQTAWRYELDFKDHLGNVRATIADLNGDGVFNYPTELIQADDYYPFGTRIPRLKPADANNYTFNGKEANEEFGLNWYHYGARFYDPAIGRWLTADAKDQFHSPYLYAGNSPICVIDPDGNFAFLMPIALGIVGGALDIGFQYYDNWDNPNWGFSDINWKSVGISAVASAIPTSFVTNAVGRVALSAGINFTANGFINMTKGDDFTHNWIGNSLGAISGSLAGEYVGRKLQGITSHVFSKISKDPIGVKVFDYFQNQTINLNSTRTVKVQQLQSKYITPKHVSELGSNVANSIMTKVATDFINSSIEKQKKVSNEFIPQLYFEIRKYRGF